MQRKKLRTLFLLGAMIAVTCSALAYSDGRILGTTIKPVAVKPVNVKAGLGIVSLSGNLVQDKVEYKGSGEVGLQLTMTAADLKPDIGQTGGNVDMVIVLDRSGSMQGDKINDARQAIVDLISRMTPGDRLGIVSYANSANVNYGLQLVTNVNRARMQNAVWSINAGGGTNLGGGLQLGLDVLRRAEEAGNQRRLILISDGLANQGLTDPAALGRIAAGGSSREIATSTVGVGNDFNENLMTSLADYGTGKYYYLEDPGAFASVFLEEFKRTVATVATALKVRVPLTNGVSLVSAGGYPVTTKNGVATFRPGTLASGQQRRLFLTLRVPTSSEQNYRIDNISMTYNHDGRNLRADLDEKFRIACVRDRKEAYASINKGAWEKKVLGEDLNRLREGIASDIKAGKKDEAYARIKEYKAEQEAVNAAVGSALVADSLVQDLDQLEDTVNETFVGAPAAVAVKQKKASKSMQYRAYEERRSN